MATCRDFAARWQRASAGLQPRRSPVIGFFAAAAWNAAGISSPTPDRAVGSMQTKIPRQAALAGDRRSDRATLRWPDEQEPDRDDRRVSACVTVFGESSSSPAY